MMVHWDRTAHAASTTKTEQPGRSHQCKGIFAPLACCWAPAYPGPDYSDLDHQNGWCKSEKPRLVMGRVMRWRDLFCQLYPLLGLVYPFFCPLPSSALLGQWISGLDSALVGQQKPFYWCYFQMITNPLYSTFVPAVAATLALVTQRISEILGVSHSQAFRHLEALLTLFMWHLITLSEAKKWKRHLFCTWTFWPV